MWLLTLSPRFAWPPGRWDPTRARLEAMAAAAARTGGPQSPLVRAASTMGRCVAARTEALELTITDDGRGGADPAVDRTSGRRTPGRRIAHRRGGGLGRRQI